MEQTIDVSRPRDEGEKPGFAATLQAWDVGGISIASMTMPGQGHTRTWSNVQRPAADHWSLMMPIRDAIGNAYQSRQMAVSSLGRSFMGSGADTHVVSMFVPRDIFRETPGVLDAVKAPIEGHGVQGLLIDFVLTLQTRLQEGLHADPVALRDALKAMMLLGLSPSRERLELARPTVDAILLARIQEYIAANVTSPALSTSDLCRAFHISRSSLYRLFDGLGGVDAYLRGQRVEAVRHALEAGDPRPISVIASGFGFHDASTFSRTFKFHFGCTPSDVRGAEGSGGPSLVALRRLGRFDAFLGTLGTDERLKSSL
ncbi:AraC family transcriptional regulator [Kaistia terrae]|uniref:Helix-turn-helix domain-containing protein n=1 Tax=Kaistia terrae TaxID=537017 RepID=A0ABW0PYN0_9HYPH|nr:AraC family transcriptional regulator [Kaistia terrae]MCX5580270.1 AraC family transcriptional regulator [Kaistia terrae]